jgi:beta-mannosidase
LPQTLERVVLGSATLKKTLVRDKTMRLDRKLALAALSAALRPALAQTVVDLTGDGWTVSSKALNISVPGKLPSQVHLDLLAAKAIGEYPIALSQRNRG